MNRNLARRQKSENLFRWLCTLITWSSLVILMVLLAHVTIKGFGRLSFDFFGQLSLKIC